MSRTLAFGLLLSCLLLSTPGKAAEEAAQQDPLENWYRLQPLDSLLPHSEQVDSVLLAHYVKLKSAYELEDHSAKASILKELGWRYKSIEMPDSAISVLSHALEVAALYDDKYMMAIISLNLGIVYKEKSYYQTALYQLDLGLEYYEASGDTKDSDKYLSRLYNTMGNCNIELYAYDRAQECFEKAARHAKVIDDLFMLGQIYNNWGSLLTDHEQPLNSIELLQKSRAIKLELQDSTGYYTTLFNLGLVHFSMEQLDSAKWYLTTSLAGRRVHDNPNEQMEVLNMLIVLATELEELEPDMEAYFREANNLADKVYSQDIMAEYYRAVSLYYDSKGLYQQSLVALKKHLELMELFTTSENIRVALDLHLLNDSERKKKEIELLLEEQEAFTGQVKIGSAVGVVILILLALVAKTNRSRYLLKKRSEEKIRMLMRELHHRVKNNLQVLSDLLSLQSARLAEGTAKEAVKAGEDRVNAMALIHRDIYLSDELQDIDMPLYISKLVKNLMTSYGYTERQIQLELESDPLLLDVDKAIPLGLIINELVSNAFKYAYEGHDAPHLAVSLNKQGPKVTLKIADNGVGIPEGKELNTNSFGLKLVQMLTRQLQGSIETFTSSGMSYQLQFNLGR